MLTSKKIKSVVETIIKSKDIPEHMTCNVYVRTSNDFYEGICAHVKIKMSNILPEELKSFGLLKKPSNPHNLITVNHAGDCRSEKTSIFLDLVIPEKDIDYVSWIEENVDSMLARYKLVSDLIDQMHNHVISSKHADMVKRCMYVHGSDFSDGDYRIYVSMGKDNKFSSVKTDIYDHVPDADYISRAINSDIDKCAKRLLMSCKPTIPDALMSQFRSLLLTHLDKCKLSESGLLKKYPLNGGWCGRIPDTGVFQSNSVVWSMRESMNHAHEYLRRVVDSGELNNDYFILGIDSYGMALRGINAIEIMVYSQNTGFSCGRIKYQFVNGIPRLGEVEYGFFRGSSFNYLP